MKTFLLLLLSLSFTAANANCLQALTQDYQVDGRSFKLSVDDLRRDFGNDKQGEAIALIKHLIKTLGCERSEINFAEGSWGKAKSRCVEIVPGKASSQVCYIETNLGYFTLSWDYLTGAYLTYHRWD